MRNNMRRIRSISKKSGLVAKLAIASLFASLLAGCNFQPLYSSPDATIGNGVSSLNNVAVAQVVEGLFIHARCVGALRAEPLALLVFLVAWAHSSCRGSLGKVSGVQLWTRYGVPAVMTRLLACTCGCCPPRSLASTPAQSKISRLSSVIR